jgi:nucleoside-diphosphate-sugar epimerase
MTRQGSASPFNKSKPVNLGAGMGSTFRDLVDLIRELTKYSRLIGGDTSKPDGQPKRSLDVSRAQKEFGFMAKMPFREGLKRTIEWYREHSLKPAQEEGSGDHC